MVNIIISSDQKYGVDQAIIQSTVLSVLNRHKIGGKVEVGISIIGDRRMHELNRKYRGVDSTTDILTFAMQDPTPINMTHLPKVGFVKPKDKWLRLGDIVVSFPQILEDAALDGISVDEEIRMLVEHGVAHLLGHHH